MDGLQGRPDVDACAGGKTVADGLPLLFVALFFVRDIPSPLALSHLVRAHSLLAALHHTHVAEEPVLPFPFAS